MRHFSSSIWLIASWILQYTSLTLGQQDMSDTLPEPPFCGTVLRPLIVGGEQTTIDAHPWTALLTYNSTDKGLRLLCVGSLINLRWVITAAHCINAPNGDWQLFGVRLGEWNISSSIDCVGLNDCATPHIDVSIDSIFIHPDYVPGHPEHGSDIALLRLERTVTITTFVKPVCLMRSSQLRAREVIGARSTILGWGRTVDRRDDSMIKVKSQLNILPPFECNRTLDRYGNGLSMQPSQMCAGGNADDPGLNTCDGDDGGPLLMQYHEGIFTASYMIGISSIESLSCAGATTESPTIFTRISLFIDWIQEIIAENGRAKYAWAG